LDFPDMLGTVVRFLLGAYESFRELRYLSLNALCEVCRFMKSNFKADFTTLT